MGLKKWGFLETVTCLDIDVLDGWHFHGIEGLETTVDVLTRILLPRSSRTAAVHSLVRLLCATLFVPTVCPCFWSVHSEHVKTYGFWVPNFVKKIGDSKKELSDVVCSDIYLLIVHSFIRESLLIGKCTDFGCSSLPVCSACCAGWSKQHSGFFFWVHYKR